jgi:hypothetical protein
VVGLLLLIPPTRAAIRRLAMRVIGRRMSMRVVEGTATEYEPPPQRLER